MASVIRGARSGGTIAPVAQPAQASDHDELTKFKITPDVGGILDLGRLRVD